MLFQWCRCSLLLFVIVAAIAACAEPPAAKDAGMTRYVLEHDGLEREYFVFLPSTYAETARLPLGIFLHGYGGTATGTEAEVTQGLNIYAEKFGYVMVYPQGTWFMAGSTPDTKWEATTWNHISDGFDRGPDGPICTADAADYPCPPECGDCGQCGWTSCNDDVGFLRALVTSIHSNLEVDADRTYVTGFSNGAMMANRIGCEASELFAAVALVGGRVEPGFECTPGRALPLLQINGGNDTAVPANGNASGDGYFFASSASTTEHWIGNQSCAAAPQEWSTATIESENVQCTIACGGSDHPAIDCLWPEGNHRWPGTLGLRGSNGYCVTELQSASMPEQTLCIAPELDVEIWGSQLLFEFFDAHRRSSTD